jgi:hypothetical protein
MNVGRYLRGEDRHVGTARAKQPQPPQRTWVGLTVDELITLEQKHIRHEDLCRAIEAKLKENT